MITDQTRQATTIDTIETPAEAAIIDVPEGLMGKHQLQRFAIIDAAAGGPFHYLVSLDEAEVGFAIAEPARLFSNYEVEIGPEREVLGIETDEEVGLYVVLTIGENPMKTTANLLAPLLVNKRTQLARQLVLSDSRYSTKHPIIASRQQ